MFYGKRSSVFEQQQNQKPLGENLSITIIGNLHITPLLKDIALAEIHPEVLWIPDEDNMRTEHKFVSILNDIVLAITLSDHGFKLTLRDNEQRYCHKIVYARQKPDNTHHNEDLLWQNMVSQGFVDLGYKQAKPALVNKLFMLPEALPARSRRAMFKNLLTHP